VNRSQASDPPPDDTTFRELMCHLRHPWCAAEWPCFAAGDATAEFARQRARASATRGRFQDRYTTTRLWLELPEVGREGSLHCCLKYGNRGVPVGTETFWRLGYEWPNP